jgi:LysR family cyn operon transcriptional activator
MERSFPWLGVERGMHPDIEIRHLRYFLTVAETENFTRAAERLGVTQPNVSQQIKDLEDKLGTPLLRRLGKRARMTDAGAAFATAARIVLRKLEDARDSVRYVSGGLAGLLEISTAPLVNLAWVPPVLERMLHEFPGVTINVTERATHIIETEVEAGRCDIGLGILSHRSPNLHCEMLAKDSLALVVSESHPLAEARSVEVKGLADQRLVLLPSTFDVRHWAEDLFRRAHLRPRVAMETNTVGSALAIVEKVGLATLLPPVALVGRNTKHLRVIKIAGELFEFEFGMIGSRTVQPSPTAREFARILRESLAPIKPRASRAKS